ncbi:parathyroid hormone 1b [Phycodurus eques]|uniref:parathyroid hormone 1b n=1 Tax=Phycodurus eques TaxID=693459 RepID=UPI002ACDDB3E|nr:parathyroid hormone 1b [Phycodurus eques]
MVLIRCLETAILILLFSSLHTDAKPLRKRTISEVQLMHNVQEHKQVGERQGWLQEKLKDIIVSTADPQHGQLATIKNIFPNEVLGARKQQLN